MVMVQIDDLSTFKSKEAPTVAEVMVRELTSIAHSLDQLKASGMPETIIMAYVQKKTKLSQRDINLVFSALKDLNKELR